MTAEKAQRAISLPRFTAVAAVESGDDDPARARAQASELIERHRPKALVAIERAGLTADGTYRNALGEDYSEGRARLDYVVDAAAAAGVPTIGIGDGGNEIGMGAVAQAVHANVPHGPVLCATRETDVLIPAGVSNWGGYAICAALALLLDRPDIVHSAELRATLARAIAIDWAHRRFHRTPRSNRRRHADCDSFEHCAVVE